MLKPGKVVSFVEHKTKDLTGTTDDDPLEILLTFMSVQNLRLTDLFKKMDKDQSGSIDRDELIRGLEVSEHVREYNRSED